MRPFVYLAAIPFVFGCAQQSVVRAPALPSDEPLQVRLYQPTAGALNYQLSEPAYVAIFAVTWGHGISLVFPYYESQMYYPSHAGLNQQTVHGGSTALGYMAGASNEHRSLFGYANAYYVIASKYPLPLEGMLRSPYLLRSLMGANLFRATNLAETWDALEAILVAELPARAWASDVYLNWRDPFLSVTSQPDRFLNYCGEGYGFLMTSGLFINRCDQNRAVASSGPPPTTGTPRAVPPAEPLDRKPYIPLQPPRIIPEDAAARITRGHGETVRQEQTHRSGETRREAPIRAPERNRPEPSRPIEREVTANRQHEPAQPRAPESRPQPAAPAQPESRWPEP